MIREKLLKYKEKIPKLEKDSLREVLLLAGFFTFCYGIWQVYPPAAHIVGGALVMYFAAP